jgi:SAM-dependent methyltransferase
MDTLTAKRFVIKYVTKREIRDIHQRIINIVNSLGAESVLDIAPTKNFDISTQFNAKKYMSIGFEGFRDPDINMDLEQFPYPIPDNSFDIVIASNILEHLHEPWKTVDEAVRIGRRWLLISLPTNSFAGEGGKWGHLHDITPDSFDMFVEQKCRLDPKKAAAEFYVYGKRGGKCMPRAVRNTLAKMSPKRLARNWLYLFDLKKQHS